MYKYQENFSGETIIAPNRRKRPKIDKQTVDCPFCSYNIDKINKKIKEVKLDNMSYIYIVANKYPVVENENIGVHDVIIDTDKHDQQPKDFSLIHWTILLKLMRERWNDLVQDGRYEFIQIFKNNGRLAGASIFHSHWQLVALNKVPYTMIEKYSKYDKPNYCYLCEKEHLKESILIYETSRFEIIAPPKPEYYYEVWVVPKCHRHGYGDIIDDEIEELGFILKKILQAYDIIIPNIDYNICMMSGDISKKWRYHFHIRLMMRVSYVAGFEISTGCSILTIEPKTYALKIKQLLEE